MAINVSTKLLKEKGLFFSYRARPIHTIIFKLKGFCYEIIRKAKRKRVIKKLSHTSIAQSKDIQLGKNLNESNIFKYKEQFKSVGYTFIEDFFSRETHDQLCDFFPDQIFFNAPRNGAKYYFWSEESRWINNDENTTFKASRGKDFFDLYPAYKELYRFLQSEEMSKKVKEITGSKNADLHSIALTRAEEGSYLAPHLDTVAKKGKPGDKIMMNFIYFLLAGGASPEDSGGTGLYNDNEFKEPVFIPPTIRNSALLYDSIQQYNHGFNTMAQGSFRWAIVFQFKIS